MLIAILAVLKSGGSYVPIDPSYPDDRISYILADIKTKVILTNEIYQKKLSIICRYALDAVYTQLLASEPYKREVHGCSIKILSIDSHDFIQQLEKQKSINPKSIINSSNLAYVIYTSGTTGNPKGVMIEHKGVINQIKQMVSILEISESSRIACFSNYAFDASVYELFPILNVGGELHILSNQVKTNLVLLFDYYKKFIITQTFLPTALFKELNDNFELSSLKTIYIGGESIAGLQKLPKHVKVINQYGPTEATVCTTQLILKDLNYAYIGKPIDNIKCYILDNDLTPLPIGTMGELYIGGVGLARGYLNLPELTSEKFITNPFQTLEEKLQNKNARLYKSGDLVRMLPDGNLEYIGRNDFQVKIRGYRIELGEIETSLCKYPEIKQGIVLALEHKDRGVPTGNKYLVGYYVANTRLDEEKILNYLDQHLPEYMVPNVLVHLEKLPLTINGKLDKKSLPEPEFISSTIYVAPQDEVEYKVCEVFAETLKLPLNRIGVRDDFFRLGGNSILAIKLISRINRELDVNLSLSSILKYKNVANLVAELSHQSTKTIEINNYLGLKPSEYKLSYAQERLWFIDSFEGGTNAYNIPILLKLSKKCNKDVLFTSVKDVVKRHEILRTVIKDNGFGNPYPKLEDAELNIREEVVHNKKELNQLITAEVHYIFDLAKDYPVRLCYYICGNINYLSILTHHIASDGWSTDVLLRDLIAYYQYNETIAKGKHSYLALPDLQIQYRDFALWQRGYLTGDILEKQIIYWKDRLTGYETLNLITDLPRPLDIDYTGSTVDFQLSQELSDSLRNLAKQLDISLYSLFFSGFYLMLHSYTNQNDLVVGTLASNRHYQQIEDLVGFFVNTLAIREEIDGETKLVDYIKKVGHDILEAQLHQDLPFEMLVKELDLTKDTSRHPIFQVMFILQSFGNIKTDLFKFELLTKIHKVSRFDLFLFIDDTAPKISGLFEYATSLFRDSTIKNYIHTYIVILEQLAKLNVHAKSKIKDIYYLDKKQYQQILIDYNQSEDVYRTGITISQIFDNQVAKTPDNIAIIAEAIQLTYRELDNQANQLAHYLLTNYHIKPDDLIVLCLDRNEYMLIAILAVLKSGGAYVPIDPNYPDERIEYILNDTQAKVIISNKQYESRLNNLIDIQKLLLNINNSANTAGYVMVDPMQSPPAELFDSTLLLIDSAQFILELSTKSTKSPSIKISPTSLAYVIYTSGTTGKPKGVMQEHHGIATRILYMIDKSEMVVTDTLLFKTNYIFDVSFSDIFCTLLCGAKLVITKEVFNIDEILGALTKKSISICHFVPSQFETIMEYLDFSRYPKLSRLMFSGEALNTNILEYLSNKSITILNYYGPTETGEITVNKINTNPTKTQYSINSNIGQVFVGSSAYILDSYLNPVPLGGVGELYVGGVGVARGYLNKSELTADKFITNPFQSEAEKTKNINAKIYKTGDLVRMLPDGNLEYIGRNDSQIKIRGYRIEPGEIEAALNKHPQITYSVVMVVNQKDNFGDLTHNKHLVAYYVADTKLEEENILNYLDWQIPSYMVPDILVYLDKLPLTVNGKLDRHALPDPKFVSQDVHIAPKDELEASVCEVIAEVLGRPIDSIGMRDNFFRLGGNSLLAIKLINKFKKVLNVNLNLADIFKCKNIDSLVSSMEDSDSGISIKHHLNLPTEQYRLSYAQERLWFIDKLAGGTNAYNLPLIFKLNKRCNKDLLFKSIKDCVRRHEVFRTVITTNADGDAYQRSLPIDLSDLIILQYSIKNRRELHKLIRTEISHVFDLSLEYPIRIAYYNVGQSSYLSVTVHHIAFDGWSVDVFIRDLVTYYDYNEKLSQNKPHTHLNLPDLEIQYKDFALWQRGYLVGRVLEKQLNYWKNKLSDYETLNLITDRPRPPTINYQGRQINFNLSEELSSSLRKVSIDLGVGLYSLLLSGFYLMLRVYSNQNDIVIGAPVANRHYPQVEDLIGCFINVLALRQQLNAETSIVDYIKKIGSDVLDAQLHQDLPFEQLVQELNVAKDQSRHPIFQVMFMVQSFGSVVQTNLLSQYELKDLYLLEKYDLTCIIDDENPELNGYFGYAVSLFNETTIEAYLKTYLIILEQFAKILPSSQKLIKDIYYLNSDDYQKLVVDYNQTYKAYPQDKTIHELFEDQAAKTPANIAIVYENIKLTYLELNKRSNQLAHYLRENYQIRPDDLIALCLDRSEHILIAILGILKSGGAYVPLAPGYPDDRIHYVLSDTKAKVVLTSKIYQEKLNIICHSGFDAKSAKLSSTASHKRVTQKSIIDVLSLDSTIITHQLEKQKFTNPEATVNTNNLACVIYTSGTTGHPKGVMIEHGNVVSLVIGVDYFSSSKTDTFALFADMVFDAMTFEIWGALLTGAKLFIPGNNRLELFANANKFKEVLDKNSITILLLTKVLFDQLSLSDETIFGSLRYLLIGGEALDKRIINKVSNSTYRPLTLVNAYGPTENTTISCAYKIDSIKIKDLSNIPIGVPLSNRTCYVLDAGLSILPTGAIGELYVGGAGIARGYLNLPELSIEKFIANPFQTIDEKHQNKNARLYKTGDLVRYLSDGNLEYLGRNDFQVKIRGYRIELAEIENELSKYEGIMQTVVAVLEHKDSLGNATGNKYLVGYYVADKKLNEGEILSYLNKDLPDYMIPSILVYLDKLPLTINGKLDRRALPDPEFIMNNDYLAPRTEVEIDICKIFADMISLPKDKISIRDDFFKLGGNSILAIKLVSKINSAFASYIKVADIFASKNVENIARLVIQSSDKFEIIVKLNTTTNKPNMFMINPSRSGCEVYISLADSLSDRYSCYGVDNSNIHHQQKIEDLNKLATYYLSEIDIIREKTKQINTGYNLLGWSLGGQIALEIAAILEQRGYKNINVILLDTFINDAQMLKYGSAIEPNKELIRLELLRSGYLESYANKVVYNIHYEDKLFIQPISKKLNQTNILLFKALEENKQEFTKWPEKLMKYILSLKYNNVDTVVGNIANIRKVDLETNHWDILNFIKQNMVVNML